MTIELLIKKKFTNEKAKLKKQIQKTNHKKSFRNNFGAKKVTFSEKESNWSIEARWSAFNNMIYFYSISEYPSENEINQCLDSFRKLHVFTPKSYKKHFKVISFSLFFQCHGSFFSVFFLLIFRTSSSQVFFKICVLKNCAIFTG